MLKLNQKVKSHLILKVFQSLLDCFKVILVFLDNQTVPPIRVGGMQRLSGLFTIFITLKLPVFSFMTLPSLYLIIK